MPDVPLVLALVASLLLSGVTYRVTRFLMLDLLIEEPRQQLFAWLAKHPNWATVKLQELMVCPWCVSVWVAGAAVLLTIPFASVPLPVWVWLASSAGCMVLWQLRSTEG